MAYRILQRKSIHICFVLQWEFCTVLDNDNDSQTILVSNDINFDQFEKFLFAEVVPNMEG